MIAEEVFVVMQHISSMLAWVSCLCVLCIPPLAAGCTTQEAPSAAATLWEPTKQLAESERLHMTVTVLGRDECPREALDVIADKMADAESCPLSERALRFAEVGINAAHFGAVREAEKSLDEALQIMRAIISGRQMTEEITRLNAAERAKIFKGESQERAVCMLYRGLLYMARGEYDNARACFIEAEMQDDRMVGKQGVAGNWLSLKYLQALADQMAGGGMGIEFPKDVPDDLAVGIFEREHNALIVVACGMAPVKIHEELKPGEFGLSYRPVPSRIRGIRVLCPPAGSVSEDASPLEGTARDTLLFLPKPTEDIYIQAVSRGRREMDKVLEAKKRRARESEVTADIAEVVGVTATQAFGIYGLPVAVVSMLVGTEQRNKRALTQATADLRQISSVPGALYLGSFKWEDAPLCVQALDSQGAVLCQQRVPPSPRPARGVRVILVRIYM